MSDKNMNNNEKREKGLAMMQMMNGMPDDLALSGSPETAPVREKKESGFLRLMSSPVAAVVLSVCVAFAVVVAIVRAGQGRAVTPGGNPAGSVSEREESNIRIMDVDGIRFVISGLEDHYMPDDTVRFTAYLMNIGEPFTYNGYSFDFRPGISVSGMGMDLIMTEVNIDTDEKPAAHTVNTDEKASFRRLVDLPVRLLMGEGTYTVTLTYDGRQAVFAFTVMGEAPTQPTVPDERDTDDTEAKTAEQRDENPDLAGWTDISFCREVYAYRTVNGDAVCFLVGHDPEGVNDCFGANEKLIEPGTGWAVASSAQQLQGVIGGFKYDARYVPVDERPAVRAALASFTESFFETHDVLLFRYNTPSSSDRYVLTRFNMNTDEPGVLKMTFRDANTAPERQDMDGDFLAVIPIEKGVLPEAVYTWGEIADTPGES